MKKLSDNAKVNLIITAFLIGLACFPSVLVWLTKNIFFGIGIMAIIIGFFIFFIIRLLKRTPASKSDNQEFVVRQQVDEQLGKLALIHEIGTKRDREGIILLYWLVSFESNGISIQNVYHTEWRDVREAQLFYQRYPKGSYIDIQCSERNINEIELIGSEIKLINDGKFLIPLMKANTMNTEEYKGTVGGE